MAIKYYTDKAIARVERVDIPSEAFAEVDLVKEVQNIRSGVVEVVGLGEGIAQESTLTGIRGVIETHLPSIDDKITTVDTDNVILSTGKIRVISRDYLSDKVIDNLPVAPGSIVTGSTHISISRFGKITICGVAEFDGTIYVDCSPLGTNNYLKGVYEEAISSGKPFVVTFEDKFDYVLPRIENASITTGIARVFVNRQI
ncbi:MAG TPA: hypothetical protein ENG16_01345 [Archaeoglobus sp.]|nr:hypothetical protein [Archaeoglobus sp.]